MSTMDAGVLVVCSGADGPFGTMRTGQRQMDGTAPVGLAADARCAGRTLPDG
jgi:hypothetical protein